MKVLLPRVYSFRTFINKNSIRQLGAPEREVEASVVKYSTDGAHGFEITVDFESTRILVLNKEPNGGSTLNAAILRLASCEPADGVFDARNGIWLKHPHIGAPEVTHVQRRRSAIESWRNAFSYYRADETEKFIGLRKPQEGALHAIHAHWSIQDGVASVVMPTGTGKTETMLAALVSAQCERVLVVVPTDALRAQISEKFLTLGVFKSERSKVLSPEAQYPVVGTLEHAPKSPADAQAMFEPCNVVVTTSHIAARCKVDVQQRIADLCSHLFIDEAHHVEAPTWKAFKSNFNNARVLQFTATPFREDDKLIDGNIIYAYPLRKAQAENYFRPIRFRPVYEFDSSKADERIAQQVIAELNTDVTKRHVAMARVGSIDRAIAVHELYVRLGQFNPVVVHSNLKSSERRAALDMLRAGTSRIVVCVDMLGEGFDMPELKIAAFHDIRKSLAVTLQLAGRFTRARSDVGDATFIANTADVDVRAELRKLYTQDPDWNELLPQLSESAIAGEVETQKFLQGFGEFPAEIPIRELDVATSMVVYRTRCTVWSPEKFRKGLYSIKPSDQVHHTINDKARVLIVVTGRKLPVPWTNVESIHDWMWELLIAVWDEKRSLLYIHGSDNNGEYKSLAKALCGEDVELVAEPTVFRCFHGVKRLLLTNLGLNEQFGRRVRYVGRMGPDVASRLPDVVKQNTRKAVLSGVGYEGGVMVNIGASKKGRIWSFQRVRLDSFIRWADAIGTKVIDEAIDTDEVLEGTLIPEVITNRPEAMPVFVDWPDDVYTERESFWSVTLNGDPAVIPFAQVGIDLVEPSVAGPLKFKVFSETSNAEFELQLSGGDPANANYRFVALGKPCTLRRNSVELDLLEFFDSRPPLIWFSDGSYIEGNLLVKLRSNAPLFDKDKIDAWDWSGIDLRKEALGVTNESDSIQHRVVERMCKQGDHQIIYDDDGAGESADVVGVSLKQEDGKSIVEVDFYHCKYTSGEPGARVDDLYEVCGQAQKSVTWIHRQMRHGDLFLHLLRRDPKVRGGGQVSRYRRGTRDELVQIKDAARASELRLRMFIVQPGLSKSKASDAQLTLLSVTEAYLAETYQVPLSVIASE